MNHSCQIPGCYHFCPPGLFLVALTRYLGDFPNLIPPSKEIQPVHSKGNQSWVFFGRNDAKAVTPVLWPPHAKRWLTGKDSDAGRDWGQEGKGTTEDEMAGWHHRLDGHEFEWTPGVGDGRGGLACCNSWGRKELDTTERLNWTESLPGTSQAALYSPGIVKAGDRRSIKYDTALMDTTD